MDRVPVMRPQGPSVRAVLDRLETVAHSGRYANFGPQEQELRERYAVHLGVSATRVATAANATLGLMGAVSVLGGARWLVPTFTFPATLAAVLAAGADAVLGDIDPRTWVLDPQGEDVDGWLPVAPFGAAPDIVGWAGSGRVVHDAAASLGNALDLSVLPPGQAVVFSLHATKVLGAGEGGIVVFGDDEEAERFRAWTNFGFAGSRESQVAGLNAKLSEVQACFAHGVLDRWPLERAEWEAARARVAALAAQVGLEFFIASQNGINPYAIAVFATVSDTLRAERSLATHQVGTRRWWSYGCHRMPAYAAYATRAFPVAEHVAATSLGLPIYRGISDEDVTVVAEALTAMGAGL
jgi:dTDP-4-amino-4,6-dideoxygalactose transaminase